MNIFLTTSNALYQKSRDFNAKCALKYGKFDKVIVYDNDTDIDEDFRTKNKKILSIEKGAGLWLWKIYFIHKALVEECKDGDVLFYLDAAGFFFRNVTPLIASMNDDIFAVELPYIEEEFTKSELFDIMNMNDDVYKKSNQFQASYMAFRKSQRSLSFVNEWILIAQNENAINPEYDVSKQVMNFHDHRMDQSIFSLLCKKYCVNTHCEVSQFRIFGYPLYKRQKYILNHAIKEYPVSIFLHRTKAFPNAIDLLRTIKRFIIDYIICEPWKRLYF